MGYVRRRYGAGMEALLRDIINEDLHAVTAADMVTEIEDFLETAAAEEHTVIKPSTATERAVALEAAKAASARRSSYVQPAVSRPLPPGGDYAPLAFPTIGLGAQNADPVKAAEYIARLNATHGPGGTQNRPGMGYQA